MKLRDEEGWMPPGALWPKLCVRSPHFASALIPDGGSPVPVLSPPRGTKSPRVTDLGD